MAGGGGTGGGSGAGRGEDSDGRNYNSLNEMWKEELGGETGRSQWYSKATEHWLAQEASLNGVLGGFPETNGPDLRESKRFLDLIRQTPSPPGFGMALDAGAGIGRVSEGLLMQCFEKVDLVEPCAKLLETARQKLEGPQTDRFISASLQDFEPEADRYDCIWLQWVLLYLPDDDLIEFLQRCILGLREGGMICVKENVVLDANGKFMIDREDNSIMRTEKQYKAIFKRAGLTLTHELIQACWPPDLFPVKMYALRPTDDIAPVVKKKPAAEAQGR